MTLYLKTACPPDPGIDQEDLAILLDESGSMDTNDLEPTRLVAAKFAATGVLGVKGPRYPSDRVAVVGFSTGARVHHPLAPVGTCEQELRRAIQRVDIHGATEMAAGLRAAADLLGAVSESSVGILRALRRWIFDEQPSAASQARLTGKRIIMLSDGENTGRESPVAVADALKQQGVVIDTIGVGATPAEIDEDTLKAIASANPNGSKRYVFIKDTAQLIRKFKKLAGHLRRLEA